MARKAKTVVIKKKGKKPIKFKEGGLHETTGTPAGQKIPRSKIKKALAGGYGKKGVKQAALAEGALKKGQKTARKNKAKRKRGKK